jgi:hypothetical protein
VCFLANQKDQSTIPFLVDKHLHSKKTISSFRSDGIGKTNSIKQSNSNPLKQRISYPIQQSKTAFASRHIASRQLQKGEKKRTPSLSNPTQAPKSDMSKSADGKVFDLFFQ